jgi:hypothetical protein
MGVGIGDRDQRIDCAFMTQAAAYARLRELTYEMEILRREMDRQVEWFKTILWQPPLKLCVQKQRHGYVYLRWRFACKTDKPDYLSLESERGRSWLATLDAPVRRVYIKVGRTALHLNFLHAQALQDLKLHRKYIAQLKWLDAG